jgi:hypothetical protein
VSAVREGYAKERLTEIVGESAADALIAEYGEPELEQRTHGGTRMDSRWNEHRFVFPWKDGWIS